jgi:hypothetical protein
MKLGIDKVTKLTVQRVPSAGNSCPMQSHDASEWHVRSRQA